MTEPRIAAAAAEDLAEVEALAAGHAVTCRGCAACVSLARHLRRAEDQAGLLAEAAAEPAGLF